MSVWILVELVKRIFNMGENEREDQNENSTNDKQTHDLSRHIKSTPSRAPTQLEPTPDNAPRQTLYKNPETTN